MVTYEQIRFCEIKSDLSFYALFGMKEESVFTIGRIENKTQFPRPNRCVAAERTTEYEL